MRNKDINLLLNEKDRNELRDIIDELPEDYCSKSLQTFLALQVKYLFINYCKNNTHIVIIIIISGE